MHIRLGLLVVALSLAGCASSTQSRKADVSPSGGEIQEQGASAPKMTGDTTCFMKHAATLSADSMGGRGVGTEGLEKAARYIEDQFRELGLEPRGSEGYRQRFDVMTGVALGEGNQLIWRGLVHGDASIGQRFMPLGFSSSGRFSGPLVFAGYGIQAPSLGYDDYAGLDVAGHVVLVMRYEPGEDDPESIFDGKRPSRWSDLRYKAFTARKLGASALIFVSPAKTEGEQDALPGLKILGPTSDAGLPVLQVTRDLADTWLRQAGRTLDEVRAAIDENTSPHSFPIGGVRVEGRVVLAQDKAEVSNIVGMIPGAGSLAGEAIVVGAHYDHLGMGGRGSMKPDVRAVHNGADDNASGVAAMLCAVEKLRDELPDSRRAVIVAAFAAEEIGLGGSSYFVEHPPIPLDRIAAMINLDMVGRVRDDTLMILGSDTAPQWKSWLTRAGDASGLHLEMGGDGYGPSDQTSFYKKGIPVIHLFSGAHPEYHTPDDDIQTLNARGGGQVVVLLEDLLETVLTEGRPTYVRATSGSPMEGDSRGYGAWLGTVPDFATMMNPTGGVRISDVRAGGPAERAGLKAGDRIVEMAGVRVRNLYDMTFVLRDHRPGDTIEVVVDRGGERVSLLATLGKRSKRGKAHGHHGTTGHEEWVPRAGRDASHLLLPEEKHLKDLRQLTFGGENAEAYFSPDGRKLIFQRTLAAGGCDQEYILNLDTDERIRLSSGKGRTTCGYFSYPDGERFIYATTELESSECPPVPDHSQGYVWPIYASYDLVWQDGPGAEPKPFMSSPGYDAEATVCHKDGTVVFTSVRDGDLELYSVRPDGTGLRRLTHTPGYDGGAFFTADCSRLVWRASRPKGRDLERYRELLAKNLVMPSRMEIFSMAADGSDVHQLTDNGAANFAPFPTPDGSRVLFASNVGTSVREFDIYMVPDDGADPKTHELERVTYAKGFDGFPMFSPDGKWLVFSSNRGGDGRETNVFIARWID